MTKIQKTIFERTVKQLRKASKEMRFKFKLSRDIDKRYELLDPASGIGFGFELDGMEYLISQYMAPKPAANEGEIDKEEIRYFGAVIVQDHGSREEPPSEDLKYLTNLTKNAYLKPQNVIPTILKAHSDWQLSMVCEGLADDEMYSEFIEEGGPLTSE
jgi:hypothetical protein